MRGELDPEKKFKVVALDGPGGVGKSSTGRAVAERLGFCFLSSGMIYRALAWYALSQGWRPEAPSPEGRTETQPEGRREPLSPGLLDGVQVEVEPGGGLRINGETPGNLAGDEISTVTSILSALPEVRELSTWVQRETVARMEASGAFHGVVLEGRDIGTVVFPETPYKIYITARPEVRAQRRYDELWSKGERVTLAEVAKALEQRDARDAARELAPLRPAEDAVLVDNSEQTFDEVVEIVIGLISRND